MDLSGYDRDAEMEFEYGARCGDPRRCPRHGRVVSSDDGLHDGLCPVCEAQADDADDYAEAMWRQDKLDACGRAASPFLHEGAYAAIEPHPFRAARCTDLPEGIAADDIPF